MKKLVYLLALVSLGSASAAELFEYEVYLKSNNAVLKITAESLDMGVREFHGHDSWFPVYNFNTGGKTVAQIRTDEVVAVIFK